LDRHTDPWAILLVFVFRLQLPALLPPIRDNLSKLQEGRSFLLSAINFASKQGALRGHHRREASGILAYFLLRQVKFYTYDSDKMALCDGKGRACMTFMYKILPTNYTLCLHYGLINIEIITVPTVNHAIPRSPDGERDVEIAQAVSPAST
jgi:hypothetical protein